MQRDERITLTERKLTRTNISPLDVRHLARKSQLKQAGWLPWMAAFFSKAQNDTGMQKVMFEMINYPLESKHHQSIWADLIGFYSHLPDNENVLAQEILSAFQTAFNCIVPTWRASGIYNTRYGQAFTREDFTVAQVAERMNKLLNTPHLPVQRRLASC